MKTIVWFRQDLRVSDNPALTAAGAQGAVIPVYILDETEAPLGGASRWWLHHSLAALRDALGGLALYEGAARDILPKIVKDTGAAAVFWNRCYEPHAIARDKDLKAALFATGIGVKSFNGSLLHEPWEIATGAGGPFKVYTPFWRASLARPVAAPLPACKVEV